MGVCILSYKKYPLYNKIRCFISTIRVINAWIINVIQVFKFQSIRTSCGSCKEANIRIWTKINPWSRNILHGKVFHFWYEDGWPVIALRKKKTILVSRSHCWICNIFIVNNIVNERYLFGKVSLIVYPSKSVSVSAMPCFSSKNQIILFFSDSTSVFLPFVWQ